MKASPRRGPYKRRPAPQHLPDEVLTGDLRQELVDDQPVVVPRRQAPRLGEDAGGVGDAARGADVVDRVVVEAQESAVHSRDDQVLVVARVADDGGAVRAARQVLEEAAALDLQLDVVDGVVELLLGDGPGAIHGVEVERRRAEVAGLLGIGRLRQPRAGVEGDVVVEELPEEGRARRVVGVVGVVRAQRQVDDERLRSRREGIGRVQEPSRLPQLAQRRLHLRSVRRERREPEDAAEVLGRQRGPAVAGLRARRRHRSEGGLLRLSRRGRAPRIQGHRPGARANRAQKPPAAQSPLALILHAPLPSALCPPDAVVGRHAEGRAPRRRRHRQGGPSSRRLLGWPGRAIRDRAFAGATRRPAWPSGRRRRRRPRWRRASRSASRRDARRSCPRPEPRRGGSRWRGR